MQLEEQTGMGKTNASRWACWVSKDWKIEVCWQDQEYERCNRLARSVVITCVCVSGCFDDDDGGGDTGGGGDDDDDGKGGGVSGNGGGDDDEDDEEEEEEEDSQCTEDQKAIAEEYKKDGWAESDWPCETFVDADINGNTGTHDHLAGYLSGGFKSGRDAVQSYMSNNHQIGIDITSDWRCPTGNVNAGSTVPKSTHVQGRAGDFTASGFDQDMWDKFERAAIAAGKTWNSPYGPDRSSGEYDGHIHIHW